MARHVQYVVWRKCVDVLRKGNKMGSSLQDRKEWQEEQTRVWNIINDRKRHIEQLIADGSRSTVEIQTLPLPSLAWLDARLIFLFYRIRTTEWHHYTLYLQFSDADGSWNASVNSLGDGNVVFPFDKHDRLPTGCKFRPEWGIKV